MTGMHLFMVILLWLLPFRSRSQEDIRWAVEKLPGIINSGYEESKPVTTSTGDSLFFVRSFHPANKGGEFAEQDIWISVRDDHGAWSAARNRISDINNTRTNMVVGIKQGNKGIFHLDYLLEGNQRSVSVYYSPIEKSRFTSFDRIAIDPIRVGWDYHDFYMHPDGDVLLISMSNLSALGKEDLFVCYRTEDGSWTGPLHMGIVLNTRGFEISPFLTSDKKTLYFSSDGFGGYGDADIFLSERIDASWQNWSKPQNLGPPFNSKKFDAYYFQNQAGEIYLASNRSSEYADLYRISLIRPEERVATVEETSTDDQASTLGAEDALTVENDNLKDSMALILTFGHDQYKLEEAELKKLDRFLAGLSLPARHTIRIIGYTDDSGSELYNKKLSYKRASYVARHIRKKGYEKDQAEIAGRGIYREQDAAGLDSEQKRRVELTVLPAMK
jgi:outer membrane protein OmpA-like peptidoglycan-associated protein